jgi:ankyrin repeat protein
VVDFLLGADGDVNHRPTAAPTYGLGIDVNLAARDGCLAIVAKHIALDPLAVHQRGVIGETPLHWAAHDGHVDVVQALLDAGAEIEADEIGLYGGKPLHWPAEHAPQVVQLLLQRGARVNSRNEIDNDMKGVTPLIMCARQTDDCAECAELLLAGGADVQATDARGQTALTWAVTRGNTRIEKLLRSHRPARQEVPDP